MEHTEKLNIHGNAESTNSINSQLIERIEVENTPFTIIREEEKWFVTLGRYRISQDMKSKEEAIEDAKRIDWDRVLQIMGITIEHYNNKSKENE